MFLIETFKLKFLVISRLKYDCDEKLKIGSSATNRMSWICSFKTLKVKRAKFMNKVCWSLFLL